MEKTALQIIEKLRKAGHEAYFAGGSVRDVLMGRDPQDYDIATSAKPDEIEQLMPKTIPIGRQFGVMLALVNGHEFEVATFRSDSSYSDGRRPDAVLFTSAKEDAVRRDFTINGLFYDPVAKKVLDYVGGQDDLKKKIIRFIGEPHERVKEDHLRILRAVRFKNAFGFKYEKNTEKALKELGHLIADVSSERIQDELTKMLLVPSRSHAVAELDKFQLLERILPEVTAGKGVHQPKQYHQEGDVFTHLLKSLHEIPEEWATKELVWAVFLHDIGKPGTFEKAPDRIRFSGHALMGAEMVGKICRRLKFSTREIQKITWLIEHHMTVGHIPSMRRAHQVALFQHPWFEDLLRLSWCDESGSVPADLGLYDQILSMYREFKSIKLLPHQMKTLLSGDEIMKEFGLPPSRAIKEILMSLMEVQIEGEVKTKPQARKFVAKIIASMPK